MTEIKHKDKYEGKEKKKINHTKPSQGLPQSPGTGKFSVSKAHHVISQNHQQQNQPQVVFSTTVTDTRSTLKCIKMLTRNQAKQELNLLQCAFTG